MTRYANPLILAAIVASCSSSNQEVPQPVGGCAAGNWTCVTSDARVWSGPDAPYAAEFSKRLQLEADESLRVLEDSTIEGFPGVRIYRAQRVPPVRHAEDGRPEVVALITATTSAFVSGPSDYSNFAAVLGDRVSAQRNATSIINAMAVAGLIEGQVVADSVEARDGIPDELLRGAEGLVEVHPPVLRDDTLVFFVRATQGVDRYEVIRGAVPSLRIDRIARFLL